jgi:acyl carrier protein
MNEKIVKIIQDVSQKSDVPAPDESLFDSGFLDSFALTDMVASLEQTFSIKVPDSDLNPRKFDTIDKIAAYVESRT